jgi:serine protease Do
VSPLFNQCRGSYLERRCTRVNSNGDTVYDVVEPNGLTRTVVLWEGNKVEVIVKGQVYEGEWMKDSDGDIRVNINGGIFAFSPPS